MLAGNGSQPIRAAWIEICIIWLDMKCRSASQPIRAAWIEIPVQPVHKNRKSCRSPFGLRGLKLLCCVSLCVVIRSQPIRAAWIEIDIFDIPLSKIRSQPIRAAWIEICSHFFISPHISGRSPFGLRGLKSKGALSR